MMRAGLWPLALLAAAACLWLGSAESDPIPAALVELVNSGSVSSTEDLRLLLLSDSVDDDHESFHASNATNRLPRSLLDAQPAQQALCKVRTEVMEVTRSMLDRSNANFLLWPPCVEVQRCSGCCNTKSLKCVPVLTHTRYLQVMKIQYSNTRPVYDKAIVSVNDHVECRCQPAPRPAPRRKSPAHKQDAREHTGKPRYKEELHRRDELKQTQRLRLEDLLAHRWPPIDQHPESDVPVEFLPSENLDHFGNSDWSPNKTHHRGDGGYYHDDGRKHNGSFSGTKAGSSERVTAPLPNHTERQEAEAGLPLLNVTKAEQGQREKEQSREDQTRLEIQKNTTISNNRLTNQTYENRVSPTQTANQVLEPGSAQIQQARHSNNTEISQAQSDNSHSQVQTNQNHNEAPSGQTNHTYGLAPNSAEGTSHKRGDVFSQAEEPNERQRGNEMQKTERGDEETVERKRTESALLMDKDDVKEVREELVNHKVHKHLDEEHHMHLPGKQPQSEKEGQKRVQNVQHKHHPHTTTQRTETTSPKPIRASRPQTPPRPPPHPPKRRRKHRNRISKAAMRAMLM